MTFKKNGKTIKINQKIIEKKEEMGDIILVYINTGFNKDILTFDKEDLI